MDSTPEQVQTLESKGRQHDKLPIGLKLAIVAVVALLLVFIIALIYVWLIPINGDGYAPTGTWSSKTVGLDTTVEFGLVTPRQRPVDINLILIRNGTAEGRYMFTNNNDGVMALANGEDVGTLTYSDMADNERIDIGDQIELTNLAPGSNYELIMIWAPDGSRITATTFATPAG